MSSQQYNIKSNTKSNSNSPSRFRSPKRVKRIYDLKTERSIFNNSVDIKYPNSNSSDSPEYNNKK